jgi:hypothetical protein
MATIKQGILGGFRGKVGSVVGSNFKGIATMRSMPLSVANPRTAAQVGNRTRFKSVATFADGVGLANIQTYWNRFAVKMSGYNLFTSVNKNIFSTEGTFDETKVIISDGTIAPPTAPSASYDTGTSMLAYTMSYAISGDRLASDKTIAVIVNTDGVVLGVTPEVVASTGSKTVTITLALNENESFYVYLVSRRADGSKVSYTERVVGQAT